MSRGRPPKGPELAQHLDASGTAKERLQLILQTIAGTLPVVEACTRLGVSEARFHELRAEALLAASQALEPKPKGRPPTPEPGPLAQEIMGLKEQVFELKADLRAAQIREQMMLLMPHVLKPRKNADPDGKKKP